MIPLVKEMLDAANQSVADLRARITEVKLCDLNIETGFNFIQFNLDGIPYMGRLAGRNKNLCVGFGEEQDKAIALRVFIDKNAWEIKNTP